MTLSAWMKISGNQTWQSKSVHSFLIFRWKPPFMSWNVHGFPSHVWIPKRIQSPSHNPQLPVPAMTYRWYVVKFYGMDGDMEETSATYATKKHQGKRGQRWSEIISRKASAEKVLWEKIAQQKVEATPHPNPTDPALGCATNQPQQGHGFLSSSYIDLSGQRRFCQALKRQGRASDSAKRQPRSYPLVMTNSLLLKMVIYSGFTHWKWWFSIVMLVYQRVPSNRLRPKARRSLPAAKRELNRGGRKGEAEWEANMFQTSKSCYQPKGEMIWDWIHLIHQPENYSG